MVPFGPALSVLFGTFSLQSPAPGTVSDPSPYQGYFRKYCADCHLEGVAKGGLDLAAQSDDLRDAENLRRWIRIYDRVCLGEMPPPKKEQALGGERDYPLSNLFVSMLQRFGIDISSFGTGTGTMRGLEFA